MSKRPKNLPQENPSKISFFQIFTTFFRIGLTTFGGGFSMATVLRHEIVLKRRWLSEREFFNSLSTATSIPGAVAVNLAFIEGSRLRGIGGGLIAATGQICPSVLVILGVAQFAVPYFDQPLVSAFLKGAAIAVTGQIAFAAVTFARRLRPNWQNILTCGLSLTVVAIGNHPIWAILTAAFAGYLIMHQRMARREWTENDEIKLVKIIAELATPELLENSTKEEFEGIIFKRKECFIGLFETIGKNCPVLDIDRTTTSDEFFDLASEELAKKLTLPSESISTFLKKQEEENSTIMNSPLRMPHLLVEGKGVFEILIARSRKGIHFSKNAPKVNIIFVLIGSIDQKNNILCALAAITQIAGSAGFLEQWLQSKQPNDLKKIVSSVMKSELS